MFLLPPSIPGDGEDDFTGIVCPDCSGNLVIRANRSLVTFVCRIGHVYSAAELVAAKEEVLERRLWIAYSALDELAKLLDDFERQGLESRDSFTQRRRSDAARGQAERLRSIIESDRPLMPRAIDDGPIRDSR